MVIRQQDFLNHNCFLFEALFLLHTISDTSSRLNELIEMLFRDRKPFYLDTDTNAIEEKRTQLELKEIEREREKSNGRLLL